MRNFNTVIQFLAENKTTAAVFMLFFLSVGVFTTVYLTGQNQDIRQRADTPTEPTSCEACLQIHNGFLCRNADNTTSCQQKDVSDSFPGMICIDCTTPSTQSAQSNQKTKQGVLDQIKEAVDRNNDGMINQNDANTLFQEVFLPKPK